MNSLLYKRSEVRKREKTTTPFPGVIALIERAGDVTFGRAPRRLGTRL